MCANLPGRYRRLGGAIRGRGAMVTAACPLLLCACIQRITVGYQDESSGVAGGSSESSSAQSETSDAGQSGAEATVSGDGEVAGSSEASIDDGTGTDSDGDTTQSGSEDPSGSDSSSNDDSDDLCEIPRLGPCDGPDMAFGGEQQILDINCSGTPLADGFRGISRFGGPEMMAPTLQLGGFGASRGEGFIALSTGDAWGLRSSDPEACGAQPPWLPRSEFPCPSSDLAVHNWDPLPAPLTHLAVDYDRFTNCADDLGLVGTGDCSNSLFSPWNERDCNIPGPTGEAVCAAEGKVRDGAGLRLHLRAPEGALGLAFDFALLTAEYPVNFRQSPAVYSDLFIAWLHSTRWTGNIAYDGAGSAITADTSFLRHFDAPHPLICDTDCRDPMLHGFAMRGHAGTPWLTSVAPVAPGEDLTLTWLVFDMGHDYLDTAVLLDNFRWLCSDPSEPHTRVRAFRFQE